MRRLDDASLFFFCAFVRVPFQPAGGLFLPLIGGGLVLEGGIDVFLARGRVGGLVRGRGGWASWVCSPCPVFVFFSPIDMFVGPWSRVSKRATNQVVSVVGGLGGIMLGWRRGEAVSSLNSWNRPSGGVTLMLYPVDRCVLGFFFFHPAVV